MVPLHTCSKLNVGIQLLVPTATPSLLFTKIVGNFTGNNVGSFIVPSKLSTISTAFSSIPSKSSHATGESLASVYL